MYKLYQFPLPSIARSKNLFIIIRNFDIFGDKDLSQGLIAILRKITQVTAAERKVGEQGGGGLAPLRQSDTQQSDTREYTYHSKYEALTQCCSIIVATSWTSARHKNNIGSMPRVNWVWSQPICKLQTLTQC